MDANQWPQEIGGGRAMKAAAATAIGDDELMGGGGGTRRTGGVHVQQLTASSSSDQQQRVKGRPQKDQVVNCPRCQSTNTKFCYYNNYSLTQPRYFCKTCRRYWTSGGTLRNVPVGGGSRKNRRSSSSSSSSISNHKIPTSSDDANISNINNSHFSSSSSNPNHHQGGHDLNITFPYGQHEYHHFAPQIQLFEYPRYESSNNGGTLPPRLPHELIMKPPFAALELLRNNRFPNSTSSSNNSHMIIEAANSLEEDRRPVYNVGFPFQELKPTTTTGGLSFSVDRFGSTSSNRYGVSNNGSIEMDDEVHVQQRDNNCEKVMFPLEASLNNGGDGSTSHHMQQMLQQQQQQQQNKGSQQNSNGSWNGMLGGGAW